MVEKKYTLKYIGKIVKGKAIHLIDGKGKRTKLQPRAWQHF
jgi:hypothetical protein